MAKGITRITFDPAVRGPAASYMSTGETMLNPHIWRKTAQDHRFFILLHEEGHITGATKNEFEADARAFYRFVQAGYMPERAVSALSRVLSMSTPQHFARVHAMEKLVNEYRKNNPQMGHKNPSHNHLRTMLVSYTAQTQERLLPKANGSKAGAQLRLQVAKAAAANPSNKLATGLNKILNPAPEVDTNPNATIQVNPDATKLFVPTNNAVKPTLDITGWALPPESGQRSPGLLPPGGSPTGPTPTPDNITPTPGAELPATDTPAIPAAPQPRGTNWRPTKSTRTLGLLALLVFVVVLIVVLSKKKGA